MALDDLITGLNAFQQGVQQYQLGNAIRGANEQVQQINMQAQSEAEKLASLRQVGNALALQFASQGAPATTIQAIHSAIAGPAQPKTTDEAMLSGNPLFELQGQELSDRKHQQELEKIQTVYGGKKEVQGLANEGKNQKPPAKLPSKQVDNITQLDGSIDTGDQLLKRVENDKELVGILEATGPVGFARRKLDPKFSTFYGELERWFQEYRKRITGAQATDKELKALRETFPPQNAPKEVFISGIKSLVQEAQRIKKRHIGNLKKAKYDVSGFEALDTSDPRIKKALEAGYSEEEIKSFMDQ